MKNKVNQIIDSKRDEIVEALRGLLKIPSLEAEAEENAPFGKEVRNALDYTLELSKKLGFDTVDMDGYVGCVDYGEGEEMLGVMCHLDVVPEGKGWNHPPYAAEIEDGVIYARGALDDKGPTIASLYALAAIKESGIPMKRRVRILLGCNEESGWGCMNHYMKHGEIPHIAFSPDGEYPLVNSEKGILRASFNKEFKSNITINSGSRPNVVPNEAKVFVPFDRATVEKAVKESDCTMDVKLEDAQGGTVFTVEGLGAHASMPELGKNALLGAIDILSRMNLTGDDYKVVSCLRENLMYDMYGESLGLDITDPSGRQTVNAGVMVWDNDGIKDFSIDLRCPTTRKLSDILDVLKNAFGKVGLTVFDSELKDGLYVEPESELVKKLLEVYINHTGRTDAKPLAIGGGTYARAIKNAVAFGPERPGQTALVHMPNESISIADLIDDTHMIAEAIIALAAKE